MDERSSQQYCVRISGSLALFAQPELRAEGASYEVPTPSALRGVLDAVFWHPGMIYCIDQIQVLRPIRMMVLRTNGISRIAAKQDMPIDTTSPKVRTQMSQLLLRDVDYRVLFHFELTQEPDDRCNVTKYHSILVRRLAAGQEAKAPYMGRREYPATVWTEESSVPAPIPLSIDLGSMFFDFSWEDSKRARQKPDKNCRALYYHAEMNQGVIQVPSRQEVMRRYREEVGA